MGFIRRHRIAVLLLLPMLLGAAWVVYEVYASVTAKPAPDTDYGSQMRVLMLDAQLAEGERAPDDDELLETWLVFSGLILDASSRSDTSVFEAIEALGIEDASSRGYDWSVVYNTDRWLRNIEDDRLEPGLETRAEALEEFVLVREALIGALRDEGEAGPAASIDAVLALARSGEPIVRPWPGDMMLINTLLPEFGLMRRTAQMACAVMTDAAERGDWDRYVEAVEVSMWLAARAGDEPILIGYLVGVAIRQLILEQVRTDLVRGALDGQAAQRVVSILDDHSLQRVSAAFEGELVWALDAVQWTHDARGRILLGEVGALTGGGGRGVGRVANIGSIVFPRRDETEAQMRAFYDRFAALGAMSPAESHAERVAIDREVDALGPRQVLLSTMLPAVGRAASVQWQSDAFEAAVRTMLAIERHRAATGSPPASLDELVPGVLAALPVDPYAPDGRLVYRRDGSQLGYVLYSIGWDGTDDGGTPAASLINALRDDNAGTDAVFTVEDYE